MKRNAMFSAILLAGLSSPAWSSEAVAPGRLVTERPTLHSLGVRWYVDGDANRNATCEVAYRPKGQADWRAGHPLLRVMGERIAREEEKIAWTAPNMLAGSVLDLEPDTEYEVRLTLNDPDGGSATKVLPMRTRGEPRAFEGGRTVRVPVGSLAQAYAQAQPGDILLLQPGIHTVPAKQQKERTCFVFDKQAAADRPIVLRGMDGAIIDGDGALKLIDAQRSAHHHYENLTFRNADHLIYAGRTEGSQALAFKRCRFEDAGFPIFAIHNTCRDFYIADCTFIGPNQIWHPRNESSEKFGASHAVWLMGQGHVVCHNRIVGYWDGIDLTGGRPPEDPDLQNCAVDIHNNDLEGFADDAIEMDYGVANIRVYRNLIRNTFMGISAQPLYGGPGYVFRNVVYNSTRAPLKPNQYPAGLLIYHNTLIAHGSAGRMAPMWQNTRIINNLFLGTDGGAGVIWTGTPTPDTSVMDHNGWYFHTTNEKYPIWWKFPEPRKVWSGSSLATEAVYRDLRQFSEDTGYEKHGIEIDPAIFRSFTPPTGGLGTPPELDLRLTDGAAAVDAGTVLPNINDNHAGNAPDLGAYEQGQPQPHYGPR